MVRERRVIIGAYRLSGSELSVVGARNGEKRCETLYYGLFDVITLSDEKSEEKEKEARYRIADQLTNCQDHYRDSEVKDLCNWCWKWRERWEL